MKVTITDKDALRALSWGAVKQYLDSKRGWKQADEVPGKALVYQRKDKNGRLWEIDVLLRDDLADYVSRMGDAVTILARLENRSELDVYADLEALGDGTAKSTRQSRATTNGKAHTADDATREVHERIRAWLAEEGWQVRDVPDPMSIFNVMATLKGGQNVNIFQHKTHTDHITISQHWVFDDQFQSHVGRLSTTLQKDLVWEIYRDVSIMGVEFDGFATPPREMRFLAYAYFDGLNKDLFIQRILLTIRALHLSIRTFAREFERLDDSAEVANKLLRLVPRSEGVSEGGGSLTVAN